MPPEDDVVPPEEEVVVPLEETQEIEGSLMLQPELSQQASSLPIHITVPELHTADVPGLQLRFPLVQVQQNPLEEPPEEEVVVPEEPLEEVSPEEPPEEVVVPPEEVVVPEELVVEPVHCSNSGLQSKPPVVFLQQSGTLFTQVT